MFDAWLVSARLAQYLGLMTGFGLALFAWYALMREHADAAITRRMLRLAGAASAFALAASLFGLWTMARSMSDGLYTQLGEQGNNLSVGQKQLLALARVLVDTPQVLILDEATANIDSGTEQAIQQALAKVRQHTTLVVIAHRLSTIVEADTILVLHRGQAVERGTHQQLLAAKGRYWQMYQLQLAGEELAASAREESLSA